MFKFSLEERHLTQVMRDEIMSTLSSTQSEYLNRYLKRGKRTAFSNVMAKEKARLNSEDAEDTGEEWELLDYIDEGPTWRETSESYCECGIRLRYQYVVKNEQTEAIRKFGKTHFEEHTGISSALAKAILKGFERIDHELDEVLIKLVNGWQLADDGIDSIPSEINIPQDIQDHFKYELPLLDKQIIRLNDLIRAATYELNMNRVKRATQSQTKSKRPVEQTVLRRNGGSIKDEIDFVKHADEIGNSEWWSGLSSGGGLSEQLKLGIVTYLKLVVDESFLARDVCRHLVRYHEANGEVYSSGTYHIYPDVCMFLEELVNQGRLEFIARIKGIDHEYKIIDSYLL